ncbi:hypothetical protein ZIOFF_043464 [Zingiber officinale]|uniref:KOW domain-containing protein n=1 Tax=Zingiber officinale TaxID=94328 RepID=A0A8J5KQ13_ZINOF|nr:hypothetical protein ZIOFF_043464 [Zingiber officinale]
MELLPRDSKKLDQRHPMARASSEMEGRCRKHPEHRQSQGVQALAKPEPLRKSRSLAFTIGRPGGRAQSTQGRMGWKAAEKLFRHWKILRGDNVMIIRGKDKGETGIIKRIIRSQNSLFKVIACTFHTGVKKHIKQGQGHEGGIFSIETPLHVSNVQVLDPVTGKPCKTRYKYLEDGTKVWVSRGLAASGAVIPRPEILKERRKPRPSFGTFSFT